MESQQYKKNVTSFIKAVFPDGLPEETNCIAITCNNVEFNLMFDPQDLKVENVATSNRRYTNKRPKFSHVIKTSRKQKEFKELLTSDDKSFLDSLRVSVDGTE
jgi:hypothetical protein